MSNPTPKKENTPAQDAEEVSSEDQIAQSTDEFPDEEDNLLGKVLGNYRLIERVGEGASAVVYRAEHVQLGVHYAVKILHPAILSRKGMRERFLREARAAGQLRHENVVFIADFAIDSNIGPYMVMEYLEGETLQAVLEREGALPLERILSIAKQACQAISLAHEAGIIHRDLKPENIALTPRKNREVVKILDFGIARLSQSDASLTGAGHIIGTPLYMSPEQCRGNTELTKASDIYSFGVLLYQMLTGQPPFTGDNPQKLIIDHFLVPPPELGPEFPDSLRKLQADLLAKNPVERPENMEEVWERLSKALSDDIGTENTDTRDQLPALGHEDISEDTEPPHDNPHLGAYAGLSTPAITKQTHTWTDNFQAAQQNNDILDPPTDNSNTPSPRISLAQETSRQTLDFATPNGHPETGIRLVNDPMRQTLQTAAIQPSSVVVQHNKKRSNEPTSHDPLMQDLEQIFSPQTDLQQHNHNSSGPYANSSDPDAELLKDLDRLSQPSSSPPIPWSTEEPVIELWNKKENHTPSSNNSFMPPNTPASSYHLGPQTPSSTGNFHPPSSPYASHMPTTTNFNPTPKEEDEHSHTEIDLAAINLSTPDIGMTSEDVHLAQRLRELDLQNRTVETGPNGHEYNPNAVALQFDDDDPLGQHTNTKIELSNYTTRRRRNSPIPILLLLLIVILALGCGFVLISVFFPSVLPPSLRIINPHKPNVANIPNPNAPHPNAPQPKAPKPHHCVYIHSTPSEGLIYQKINNNTKMIGYTPKWFCGNPKTSWIVEVKKELHNSTVQAVFFQKKNQKVLFSLTKKK